MDSPIKEIRHKHARGFVNVFRFIGDLTAINDGGEFEKSCKELTLLRLSSKRRK